MELRRYSSLPRKATRALPTRFLQRESFGHRVQIETVTEVPNQGIRARRLALRGADGHFYLDCLPAQGALYDNEFSRLCGGSLALWNDPRGPATVWAKRAVSQQRS